MVGSLAWKVRRIHDAIFFADSTMLFMWVLKVASDESVTPKSFTFGFSSIRLKDGEMYAVESLSSASLPYRSNSNLRSLNCILFVTLH